MKYHKINSIFKRDMDNKGIFTNEYATEEFEYLANNEWEFTEKIDGTNIRIIYDGSLVSINGRGNNSQIPCFLLECLTKMFVYNPIFFDKISDMFKNIGKDNPLMFVGEGCGYKIQKNGSNYVNGEKRNDFILFDIAIGNNYLSRVNSRGIAKELAIRFAPVIGHGTLNEAVEIVKNGMKSKYGDFIAEGIVATPKCGLLGRNRKRIITKIKCCDYNLVPHFCSEVTVSG